MRKLNEFNLIIDDNDVCFVCNDVDWFHRTIFEQVLVCFVLSFGDSDVSDKVTLHSLCRWLYDGDSFKMLVAEALWWWLFHFKSTNCLQHLSATSMSLIHSCWEISKAKLFYVMVSLKALLEGFYRNWNIFEKQNIYLRSKNISKKVQCSFYKLEWLTIYLM